VVKSSGGQTVIGAIAGDIIGSVYEHRPIKHKDFPLFHPDRRFTDDSVLTIAIAEAILEKKDYQDAIRALGRQYPDAGYGGTFIQWLFSPAPRPYQSWGNGAAMRVSPVGFAFPTIPDVLREARKTAAITHDHPEGIKGAQAAALAVFLARTGSSKDEIRQEIADRFQYDLSRSVDGIRPAYAFDVSCQGTVPEAIISFLESESYEDAVRLAVSLGGDSDTLACITGSIAHAFYGEVPGPIVQLVKTTLDKRLWAITEAFCRAFDIKV
jgi:ADP-ribosylglycohydrolase